MPTCLGVIRVLLSVQNGSGVSPSGPLSMSKVNTVQRTTATNTVSLCRTPVFFTCARSVDGSSSGIIDLTVNQLAAVVGTIAPTFQLQSSFGQISSPYNSTPPIGSTGKLYPYTNGSETYSNNLNFWDLTTWTYTNSTLTRTYKESALATPQGNIALYNSTTIRFNPPWSPSNSAGTFNLALLYRPIQSPVFVPWPLSDSTRAFTVGPAVTSRGTLDSGSSTFVLKNMPIGQMVGFTVTKWSFYAGTTGKSVTPLLLEFVSGTTYKLRAYGASVTPSSTGVQTQAFDVQGGNALVKNTNYRIGWKDGTATTANTGVINFDNSAGVVDATLFLLGTNVQLTTAAIGTSITFTDSGFKRLYSLQLTEGQIVVPYRD